MNNDQTSCISAPTREKLLALMLTAGFTKADEHRYELLGMPYSIGFVYPADLPDPKDGFAEAPFIYQDDGKEGKGRFWVGYPSDDYVSVDADEESEE